MSALSYLKGLVSNVHVPGEQPDIFLFSTPRSGSTFLMEILSAQPGMKVYDEPVTVNKAEVRRALGVQNWEELTVMADREARYRRFFDRLRQNRMKELNRPFYRRDSRFLTRRIVFKMIHGGEDMIPWFASTFGARILLLVRHPIPTALSHKQLPRLPHYLRQPGLRELFTREQIAFAERLIAGGSTFERGILNWSIQNAAMLKRPLDPGWTLVTYEDLTLHPRETFDHLRARLGLEPVENLEELAAVPSVSTVQSDAQTRELFASGRAATERRYLVEKWRGRVTPEDERRAFEICDAFGVRVYQEGSFLPRDEYRIPALRAGAQSRDRAGRRRTAAALE